MKFRIILLLFFAFSVVFNSFSQEMKRENTALILVDIQMFYFPGGMAELKNPVQASERAKDLLQFFREKNMMVVHVKHKVNKEGDFHANVAPVEGEKVIEKTTPSSFYGTNLDAILKENNIENVVVIGMQTHMCLEATARAAHDLDYNCIVAEDACTTRDLVFEDYTVNAKDVHYSTLATLNRTYAKVLTVEGFITEYAQIQ